MSHDDAGYWAEHGPLIRRSLKYLAELVTKQAPIREFRLRRSDLIRNLEALLICGEMLVEMYILSDQTYGLHPDNTTLTIFPEGADLYWELEVDKSDQFADLAERVRLDTERRGALIPGKQPSLDFDFQGAELDTAFQEEFGFTYREAMQALRHLADTAVVINPKAFDVPFVHRDTIIEWWHEDRGWSEDTIARLLDGFTVTTAAMELEGRQVFKPKQEHRAYRRGFFEMPHESGLHLMWSRRMARECLLLLKDGTVFQHLPPEWRIGQINGALSKLQRKAGVWFEGQVAQVLQRLGAIGRSSLKDEIGVAADRIVIPQEVGEIDYLGYFPDERLLVLLEDKMVDSGSEPSHLRDDVSSFVTNKKPYAGQLRRKVEWVRNNVKDVCRGLSSALPDNPLISPTRLAAGLVTLYPSYASYFIDDYPCVALSELVTAHSEKDRWPYGFGLHMITP